jgi:hypothetical protein
MTCRRAACMYLRYSRVDSVEYYDDRLKLMGAREVKISFVMT